MSEKIRQIEIETTIRGKAVNVSVFAGHVAAIEWFANPVICCASGDRYEVTEEVARAFYDELVNVP